MQFNFKIPDLSQLRYRSTIFALNCTFRGAGPKDREAYGLVMNFIRLVDLAIGECEQGRQAIHQFASNTESLNLNLALTASGNFEVCVDALKRAIDHLKAIRSHPKVPQSLKNLLPRNTRVLTGPVESQVAGMRHRIQHLEERIKKGEIKVGQPLCLQPNEDDIQLGEAKIAYSDLSDWLKELHSLADRLASYWE